MPRAKTKTKITIVGREGDVPQQGFFPFTVRTFQGALPGEQGYDPAKDRMLAGFKFGNSTIPQWLPSGTNREDVTAYDFLTDPKTGMRAGQTIKPHESSYVNLADGIGEWVDLPPIEIWRRGKWLSELVWEPSFNLEELTSWMRSKVEKAMLDGPDGKVPPDLYPYYVVSGEGTTGNNLYRIYELPEKKCGSTSPHHPMMWEEEFRKKKWMGGGLHSAYGLGSEQTKPVVTKPAAPKPPPLPAGLRYRCPDCGHWFNQSDLPGHAMVCGKGEDADWAIMCHSDCGCETLDEAAKPKAGFPRPKPVKTEKKEEEPLALAVATP